MKIEAIGRRFQMLHCKINYEIPGFVLTKPSWDWDWANYSQPGRV